MVAITLLLVYSYSHLIQPVAAQPQFNIITNGNFSQGLTGWETGLPFCQGSYGIDTISERLRISLMNDTNARAALGQAWQFNATGFPIESSYTVKDNNHLSLDIFLDVIARQHSTKYITSLDIVVTGSPNTTITYAFNGTDGLSNPLDTVFSNSSLTGRFCFFIQMKNQTWYSLDRNLVNDLAAVAPALDPASTKYIAVVFKSYLLPFSAAALPHGDYLRTWFDNIVLGGAFSIKVYDVPGAVITLDTTSQTVTGAFVQFVNVPANGHQLTTTSPVVVGGTSRYFLANWTVEGMPGAWLGQPLPLMVGFDMKIHVVRNGQYRVTVKSSAPVTNVNIYVDGSSAPSAQTNFDFWFDNGTSHMLRAEPEIVGLTGYTFQKWQGSGVDTVLNPVTILVNKTYTLTANYVVLAATFRVQINPLARTINQGSSTTFTISVTSISGFVNPVILSASSSPTGLTLAVTPTNATPTFTATLSVSSTGTTTIGDYFVSVVGTSGALQQGAAVIVTVSGRDFSISISPVTQSVYRSLSASFTVNVQATGGFADTVVLTISGGNLTASLSATSGVPPFSSILTVSTTNSTALTTYSFTVQGTGWERIRSASASLTVLEYPPNYSVTVKTDGLSSGYATKIYIDKVESGYTVYDSSSQSFSFKALTSHNVTVDFLVSGTNIRYRCSSNQTTVSDAATLTFTFSPEYLVVFKLKLPDDQTITITVNSIAYTDETPYIKVEVWFAKDTSLPFSITPVKLLNVGGKNYSFVEWRDQNGKLATSPIKVRGPLTLTAQYIISDLTLTVYDIPGTTISLGSVTKTIPVGGTYVVFDITNGTYALSTTEYLTIVEGKVRIGFLNWRIPKGTGTEYRVSSINVTITGDSVVAEVSRVRQYYVVVSSPFGSPQGTGWCVANTTITISVTSPIDHGNSTRHVFVRWSGDYSGTSSSASVFLDSPKTILAEWKVQYKLTVSSQYGTTTGDGWYDRGSTATFSATPPTEDGVQYFFAGWRGSFSGTERTGRVEMDGPKSVSATWKRQYLVSMVFLDTKDTSIKPTPSRVIFSSPNASMVTLTSYSGIWLDEGTWILKQVIWHGVDVKKSEMSYNPKPRDTWRIQLRVYSLTVKVTSSLTGGDVGDVAVSVVLPDGSQITNKTDSKGQVVFAQLPPGTISITTEKDGSTSQRNVELSSDLEEPLKVLPTIDIIGYIVLPIVGVAGLVIALTIFVRRRKASIVGLSRPTLSPSLKSSGTPLSELATVTESKPEENLSKWIEDELKEKSP
jgi:hypothetical protein